MSPIWGTENFSKYAMIPLICRWLPSLTTTLCVETILVRKVADLVLWLELVRLPDSICL